MRVPTDPEREQMRAFLFGYTEHMPAITLEAAKAKLRGMMPAHVAIDGMMVARMLGRLGFRRSYRPEDAGAIVYRRDRP